MICWSREEDGRVQEDGLRTSVWSLTTSFPTKWKTWLTFWRRVHYQRTKQGGSYAASSKQVYTCCSVKCKQCKKLLPKHISSRGIAGGLVVKAIDWVWSEWFLLYSYEIYEVYFMRIDSMCVQIINVYYNSVSSCVIYVNSSKIMGNP